MKYLAKIRQGKIFGSFVWLLKAVALIIPGMLLWSMLYNGYWHTVYTVEDFMEVVPEPGCMTYVCKT